MSLRNVLAQVIRQEPSDSPYLTRIDHPRSPVVSILDEFSQSTFGSVLNLHAIGPDKPHLDLDFLKPEALFVESAWNGNAGKWRYMVTSQSGPRSQFVELLSECRKRGIPTVFWNKEDPVHYSEFIDAARLFDYVLTTDADLIPKYCTDLGSMNVDLLRFAASPAVHNPRRVARYREGDIAFAGQYFRHKYPERREQMDTLFSAAREFNLSIFSRALGGDSKYQFPDQYSPYIKDPLPYTDMVREYKRHKIFLNVNSVVDSSSMCARRIYELASCKSTVVSMHSEAIRSVFGEDEIPTVGSVEEAHDLFTALLTRPTYRLAMCQRAWRRVARDHTVADRVRQIRNMLGYREAEKPKQILLYVRAENLTSQLIRDLDSQTVVQSPHINVVLNVLGEATGHVEASRISIYERKSVAKHEVDKASFVGVVSSENRYGANYLEDLILSLQRYVPEPYVSKSLWDPDGGFPQEAEESGGSVVPAGWIGRASHGNSINMVDKTLRKKSDRYIQVPEAVYLTDPFNRVSVDTNASWDWAV